MAANKLLDEAEKKLDDNYQRAKAAIRVLRQSGMLNGSVESIPTSLVPLNESATDADIESACERIVNRSGRGYYRLSDIIHKLYGEGIGNTENQLRFKRRVRLALKKLARSKVIRLKAKKGRGGTTFMPKDSE